mmetsp:Transcript_14896/g.48599  ORF Transcript_14896/g.48599 Transcript_14896/m.48599 type:complete len:498 (-) Transcript_14896:144-1637(-)
MTVKDEVATYVGASITVDIFAQDIIRATARASATVKRTVTLSYESIFDDAVSYDTTVWPGPKVSRQFLVYGVPVDVAFQPRIDFRASGSIEAEASATLAVEVGGEVSAAVDYVGGDLVGWAAASLTPPKVTTATADGSMTIAVDASTAFVLTTELYRAFEVDVSLRATASFEARGEVGVNAVTDSETLALTNFDVDAVFDVPAVGRITIVDDIDDADLGVLYAQSFDELLRLPTVAIETEGRATCDADGDAEVVLLAVTTQTGTTANEATTPRGWTVDLESESSWTLGGANGDTTFALTLTGVPLATGGLGVDDVPRGSVDFRATPEIPAIPYAVVADTKDLFDLFQNAFTGIECCVDADCGDDTQFLCETSVCLNRGDPRFALAWVGDDDLDVYVRTPSGALIWYGNTQADGGTLDMDDIPPAVGSWVENIFWPLDGSAPAGAYEYWVNNYDQVNGPDSWILTAYKGDTVVATHSGSLLDDQSSPLYVLDNPEATP